MKYPKQVETLLALPDVEGLFITSDDGELSLNRLPDPFGDEIFEELGQRLTSFIDAVGSSYNPTEEMLFAFSGYSLYVRLGKGYILGILSQEHPNLMGLRVGANLLMKQIKPEMLKPVQPAAEADLASATDSSVHEKDDAGDSREDRPVVEKKEKTKKKKSSAFSGIWG